MRARSDRSSAGPLSSKGEERAQNRLKRRDARILFLFDIYHPATAPVYALLGRACVREDE